MFCTFHSISVASDLNRDLDTKQATRFPAQVHLGGFGAFWVEGEIEEWTQMHIDEAHGARENPDLASAAQIL